MEDSRYMTLRSPSRPTSARRIPALLTSRISGLDGLRAISILMVIAYHVFDHCSGLQTSACSPFLAGHFGVDVFFVISGFLITHLLCEEERKTKGVNLSGFYFRRAFRILPPALLFLFVVAHWTTGRDVLHSLLFVRNFFSSGSEITAHFWSLSVEEQFYLAWPGIFLFLGGNRSRLGFGAALSLLILVWLVAIRRWIPGADSLGESHFHGAIFFIQTLIRGHYPILLGCCLAIARNMGLLEGRWTRSPFLASVALGILVALLRLNTLWPLQPLCVVVLIHYAISGQLQFLDWAPLVWTGRLSYSLYIWQQVFCWRSTFPILSAFPLNVAASFAAAMCSYYCIERPALRIRDRLWLIHRSRKQTSGPRREFSTVT